MSEQSSTSYSIPQWTVADRLRKARTVAGLSQEELAERIGCADTTVSNYETGATTNVRRIVMRQWALATGVPEAWLRDGTEPTTSPDGDGITTHVTSERPFVNGKGTGKVIEANFGRTLPEEHAA